MTAEEVRSIPLSSFSFEEVLSDYAKGFLEAAIDGEGSIMLLTYRRDTKYQGTRVYYVPVLSIGNKSKAWLELVRELFCDFSKIKDRKFGFYEYSVSRRAMRRVLPQLGLVIKEEQRILILEALDIISKLRSYKDKYSLPFRDMSEALLAVIARKIKELNHI